MAKNSKNYVTEEIKLYRLGNELVRYFNNYLYCGEPGLVGEEREEIVLASEILGGGREDMYIAEIMGDSMVEAGLYRGDRAAISTITTAKPGDVVLALVDEAVVLKYLFVDEEGNTWLVPGNPAYRPIKVDFGQDGNELVGVMTKIIKESAQPDTVVLRRFKSFLNDEYRVLKTSDDVDKPFYKYIPNDKDKKRVTERLHNLLDGQEGVTVIKILRSAISIGYLVKMPTLGDIRKEFQVTITDSFFYRERNTEYKRNELEDYIDNLL